MGVAREQVLARVSRDDAADVDQRPELGPKPEVVREGPATAQPRTAQQLNQLARTVELEVVPRLILARGASPCPPAPAGEPVRPEAVIEFAQLAVAVDPRESEAFVASLQTRGTPIESLYLDLLAPAARHLGDLWTADLCSFSQVTLGLIRLHQVMRGLSPQFQSERALETVKQRILLTPVPGEQHSFGLFMVAEFFHRAGWQIWSGPMASIDELTAAVRADWFEVAGLSVSSDAKLETLVASIRAVRRASCNPGIGVMVGGPVFHEHPEISREVGADACAHDGRSAVAVAGGLLELGSGRG